MQAVAHRLSDDYIDFNIEIVPRKYFDDILHLVLFDQFPYHIDVLNLLFSFTRENAVDLFAACLCCEERVETIDSFGNVHHVSSFEEMPVVHNCIVIGLIGDFIFKAIFQRLQSKIVDFAQMFRTSLYLGWLFRLFSPLFRLPSLLDSLRLQKSCFLVNFGFVVFLHVTLGHLDNL